MVFLYKRLRFFKNQEVDLICVLSIFLFLIYWALCLLGFLRFELWSQVTYIWDNGYMNLGPMKYPHTLRYFLVLPIFEISSLLRIDYNYTFSLIAPVLVGFTALNISNAVCHISKSSYSWQKSTAFMLALLALCFISFFMNGRILFAFLASSILLSIAMYWRKVGISKIAISFFFGAFLSSVSSGTFTVFLFSFVVIAVLEVAFYASKKNVILLFLVMFFLIVSMPLVLMFFLKNVNFYGGGVDGFVNMLHHGWGDVLFTRYSYSEIFLIVFCVFMLLFSCGVFFIYFKSLQVPMIMVLIAGMGGMFGYSTMMMGLPPLIAIICCSLLYIVNNYYKVA